MIGVERWWRNPVVLALAILAVVVFLASAIAVAPETKQGVVLRFGAPDRVINQFHPGEAVGRTGAGWVPIIPGVEQVIWIDKRVRDIDMERQQVLSADQARLNVDAFARFRIVNPVRMFMAANNEDNVADALRPILGSALRTELGKRSFSTLLSPERGAVMDRIRIRLDRVAQQYGAQIVDVRIKKADLPEGSPLDAAYERMRNARTQEAITIRAQAYREAQIIRADADAQAAGIYAEAFNKDAQFYDFYRAMQSYRHTFGADGTKPGGSANIILSPGNDYLREFRGQR